MISDSEIREYISRMIDAENERVIIKREDIEYLAGLNAEDYERFKFELYLYTLLNNYKVIPESKLDELIQRFIELKVENLTVKTLYETNLLLPAGYDVEEKDSALVYTPSDGIVEVVAKPAFYITQFYYLEGEAQRIYIIKSLHNPSREIEIRPTENILRKVANAGVLILNNRLANKYIKEFLNLNLDYLTKTETAISGEYIVEHIKEMYLRGKVKTVRTTLRDGRIGIAFWPGDIEVIAKRAKMSYRKLLVLLEREGLLVLTSAGERERVVYLNRKERARMVVVDEKALLGGNNLTEIDAVRAINES